MNNKEFSRLAQAFLTVGLEPHKLVNDSDGLARAIVVLAWLAYHHAGNPFGQSAKALEIWFTYGQRTTDN